MDRAAREELRKRYLPAILKVLMVGESPPSSGRFFYSRSSLLYRATGAAFQSAIQDLLGDNDFLKAFRRLGFYLEDLCLDPVNDLDDTERVEMWASGESLLIERMRQLQTPRAVIVVVEGITPYVERALSLSGKTEVPTHSLRFPRKGRFDAYVEGFGRLLVEFRAAGVFN